MTVKEPMPGLYIKRSFLFIFTFLVLPFFTNQIIEAEEYGIVISVSTYSPEAGADDLPGAINDGVSVIDGWVASGMDPDNIVAISGDDATIEGITTTFTDMASRVGPNDTVNITWSSHGWTDTIYAHDGAVSEFDLRSMVETMQAGRVNIFLDSCHACSVNIGEIPGTKVTILGASGPEELSQQILVQPDAGEDVALPDEIMGIGSYFYSQAYGKPSREDAFSRGDANRDGVVTIEEVRDYLNAHNPDLSQEQSVPQQTACIKTERKSPDKTGKVIITISGTGTDSTSSTVYQYSHNSRYEMTFELERTGLPGEEKVLRDNLLFYRAGNVSITYDYYDQEIVITRDYTATHIQSAKGSIENSDQMSKQYTTLTIYPDSDVYTIQIVSSLFPISALTQVTGQANSSNGTQGGVSITQTDRYNKRDKTVRGSADWTAQEMERLVSEEYVSSYQAQADRIRNNTGMSHEKRGDVFLKFMADAAPIHPNFPTQWIHLETQNGSKSVDVHAEWSFE